MRIARPRFVYVVTGFSGILLLMGLTWANYRFAQQSPGGNDFLPRWLGTRLYLAEGQSPYSEETTASIQEAFYDRPARGNEDRQLFVYPYYSMLVFAPFALIEDYDLARAVWMTVLEASLIAIAIISLRLADFRPDRIFLIVLLLFSLLWYHGFRPVINGNASILVALFIGVALFLIRTGRDNVAGIFLALATIKPQMVILLLVFVAVWAASINRRQLLLSIGISSIVLMTASIVLQRDWMIQNLQQVMLYPEYTEPGSPGAIFAVWWPSIGERLGWGLSAFLGIILVVEWVLAWGKGYRWFLWAVGLTLIITNLIGVRTATANYIALFPALILVFSLWNARWGQRGRWLSIAMLGALFVGLWALFLATLQPGAGSQPVQNPIMFFPLPVFMLITLYWIRWWVVKGRRPGMEDPLSI